ncbi:DUF5719 family protein [Microcella sp.]|uniref:DUF5719 family protein n=1 Tax=Microcella sp. TaxID=1913979 RepID=UPI003918B986
MSDPLGPDRIGPDRIAPEATTPDAITASASTPATSGRGARVLAAGGRASLAIIVAATAAALGAGVLVVPGPSVTPIVPALAVQPDRPDQSLVCAGAALGLTRGADPQLTTVADDRRRSVGEGLVESRIDTSDAIDGGAVVVTLPRDAPGAGLAASQSVLAGTPEVTGLAAAECLAPARSAWLVGGATTVGRTSWVVLTNADDVDATVDLRLWGSTGPLEAPGASGITVPAGSQRVVPLAGLAVDEPSPVVQVSSSGGSVAATMQTSIVRGLTPSGLSIITPLAEPASRHVIAGLPVIAGQLALERSTADGGVDGLTALRLLAPGADDAAVTVTLVAQDGGVGLVTETLLEAGTVLDLPITLLADGEYGVIVQSDQPIVVAGRTSTATAETIDVEWFTPSPVLEAGVEVLTAVAPLDDAGSAVLHLVAPDEAAEVTVDGRVVTVPAGGGVVVPSPANTALRLSTTAPVHASMSYRAAGLLAGSRVLPPPAASSALTIFPR